MRLLKKDRPTRAVAPPLRGSQNRSSRFWWGDNLEVCLPPTKSQGRFGSPSRGELGASRTVSYKLNHIAHSFCFGAVAQSVRMVSRRGSLSSVPFSLSFRNSSCGMVVIKRVMTQRHGFTSST